MIFFLLILYLGFALAFLWLGSFLIFCGAKAFKSPETARPAGKCFLGLSGFAVLMGAIFYFFSYPPASVVYRNQFGERPTSDVRNLQSSSPGFFNDDVTLLRFGAVPSTIARLTKIRKLRPMPTAAFDSSVFADSRAPRWWNPSLRPRSQLYEAQNRKETSSENTSLLYEPQTQTAWYLRSFLYDAD